MELGHSESCLSSRPALFKHKSSKVVVVWFFEVCQNRLGPGVLYGTKKRDIQDALSGRRRWLRR